MPLYRSPEEARPAIDTLAELLNKAGRSLDGFGIDARIPYSQGVGHAPDPVEWRRLLTGWQALGATHASLVTTNCGLEGAQAHLRAIQMFAKKVGLVPS